MSVIREAEEGDLRQIVSIMSDRKGLKTDEGDIKRRLNPLFLVYDVEGVAEAFLAAYSSDFIRKTFSEEERDPFFERALRYPNSAYLDIVAIGNGTDFTVVAPSLVKEMVSRGENISAFYAAIAEHPVENFIAQEFLTGLGASRVDEILLGKERFGFYELSSQ